MQIGFKFVVLNPKSITTMKDFSHIKEYTAVAPASPYERAGILQHLKKIGVPIHKYEEEIKGSETHPNLVWSRNSFTGVFEISSTNGISGRVCQYEFIWLSVSDFVALFEAPALPKIGDWQPTIIVDRKALKVGCTEIPFSTVEAIYKAMK